MKLIKGFVFIVLSVICACYASAQDLIPKTLKPQLPLSFNAEQPWIFHYVRPVELEEYIPGKFKGMKSNEISDPSGSLEPFFEKLSMQMSSRKGVVRIVHIGDSHVRGHFFPGQIKAGFENLMGSAIVAPPGEVFDYNSPGVSFESGSPGVAYQIFGINGATAQKFCNPDYISKIASLKPDLIIVSFGTNEGYTRRYNSTQHLNQLDQLMRMLKESCPSASFLLTTPPGAYMKSRGRYSVNSNTEKVAGIITGYASSHNIASWDLFNIVGGKEHACTNWYGNKLMQRDRIHFTKSGYDLMGLLLFQALIKSYNTYAEH